ncbi:ABC transporter ATP-binding protein [Acholeplasma hippikon]|nr:ABC transporter ATP-binding protein [Acholeplasma hippikon]
MFEFLKLTTYAEGAKKYLLINIITAFIGNISTLLAPLFVGFAVEYMIGKDQVNLDLVLRNLIVAGILYAVGSFLLWLSNKSSYLYTIHIVSNYRAKVMEDVQKAKYSKINGLQSGDMMMKMSLQMDMIYDAISYFFIYFVPGIVTIIFTLGMLIYLNYLFAIVVVVMVPVMFMYTKYSTRGVAKYFKETQRLSGNLSKQADEAFSNHTLISNYNYEEEIKRKFKKEQTEYYDVLNKSYFLSSINNPTFRLISNTSYLLLGILFAVLNFNNVIVQVGTFSSILVYGTMFYRPVNDLSNYTSQFILASTAYRKIDEVVRELERDTDGKEALNKQLDGEIEFRNVDFSYRENQNLIKNFNLSVKKGMKVGIVGKTGAGKSTIINLLMRFYRVNKGEILLDGYDINTLKKNSFRRQYGLILQEPWLFNGTLFENISYGKKDASYEEVVAAAKLAGCHDFISKLKDGYNTQYEEKGVISVGQKQLITIARAILMNPSVVILDEATSHIDSVMEKQISDAFKELMKGKTTFMIAHRLQTIMDSDVIIVMNDGKIVEQGTHESLMSLNGYYHSLFNAQFNEGESHV